MGNDMRQTQALRVHAMSLLVLFVSSFGLACAESNVGGLTDIAMDALAVDVAADLDQTDVLTGDVQEADSQEAEVSDADTNDAGFEDTSKPEWGECTDGGEAGCPCDVPDDCK